MGTVLGMLTENTHFKIIHSAFPRIGDKLQTLWGNPEFGHYMNTLLRDTRDGARKGFPVDVFFALDALAEDHYQVFPALRPRTDVWAEESGGLLQTQHKLR